MVMLGMVTLHYELVILAVLLVNKMSGWFVMVMVLMVTVIVVVIVIMIVVVVVAMECS